MFSIFKVASGSGCSPRKDICKLAILSLLLGSCASWTGGRQFASEGSAVVGFKSNSIRESLFPDPGLKNPKLRFHTGASANNAPEISPTLPNIPGSPSVWFLTQWRRPQLMLPSVMRADPIRDPLLGPALYYFPAEDNRSFLKIYQTNSASYVYELFSSGGILDGVGGTNVFLSAEASSSNATFDKVIDYNVDLKFSRAKIRYDNFFAKRKGAVMAQLFTGFILKFEDPSTKNLPITLFMQIYHNNTSYPHSTYRGCFRHDQNMEILYGNTLPENSQLDFAVSMRPAQTMKFRLNQYLCDMISKGFSCNDNGRKYSFEFPEAAKKFENWRVSSMYVGLETQDTDLRQAGSAKEPQGLVEAGVQISNLEVIKNNSQPFDAARDCKY